MYMCMITYQQRRRQQKQSLASPGAQRSDCRNRRAHVRRRSNSSSRLGAYLKNNKE